MGETCKRWPGHLVTAWDGNHIVIMAGCRRVLVESSSEGSGSAWDGLLDRGGWRARRSLAVIVYYRTIYSRGGPAYSPGPAGGRGPLTIWSGTVPSVRVPEVMLTDWDPIERMVCYSATGCGNLAGARAWCQRLGGMAGPPFDARREGLARPLPVRSIEFW